MSPSFCFGEDELIQTFRISHTESYPATYTTSNT
jgi:hypothetical protein